MPGTLFSKEQNCTSYKIWMVVLIVVFFFSSLSVLPFMSRWHGDESFYTNAAIRMTQTGDVVTPYTIDGTPRFQKPILTYWAVLGAYKLFGISLFSSRIVFLIAAAGVMGLVYAYALLLFQRRDAAVLAVAVIFTHIDFLNTSIRSTPDILQCFFIGLSMLGLIRLFFNRDFSHTTYALIYPGTGLACAVKGALGLIVILFAFLFCIWRGKKLGVSLKQLVHIPFMIIGLVIALAWFAAVLADHGLGSWTVFWKDQVGDRLDHTILDVLDNMAVYASSLIVKFIPWSLLLLMVAKKHYGRFKEAISTHRDKCLFIIGWFALLFFILSMGNIQRTRYFLPAYTLIAGLYAFLLTQVLDRDKKLVEILKKWMPLFFIFCGALGMLLAVTGAALTPVLFGGVFMAILSFVCYFVAKKGSPVVCIVMFAVFILVGYRSSDVFFLRAFVKSPLPELMTVLTKAGAASEPVAAVGMRWERPSQMNVLSQGKIRLVILPDNPGKAQFSQYKSIVYPDTPEYAEKFRDYVPVGKAFGYEGMRNKDYLNALILGKKEETFGKRKIVYIAGKKQ